MPQPNYPNFLRTPFAAVVTLVLFIWLGWQLAPAPPTPTNATLGRANVQHSEQVNVPPTEPWLELLQQEGRFSAKVHAALNRIPEDAIPEAIQLLSHSALTAEDESGACALLWRRLTLINPETAFGLLCKTSGIELRLLLRDLNTTRTFFAAVAHHGWARTHEFLLRPGFPWEQDAAIEAALPVIKALDPSNLNEALAFQQRLKSGKAPSENVEPFLGPAEAAAKQIRDMARSDPQAALDLFLALPEHARTVDSLQTLLSGWPDGGADQLLELHQSLVKPELLTLVEQVRTLRLAKTDLPAAIAWIDSLPEDRRQKSADSILEQLLLGDPVAAQRLVKLPGNFSSSGPRFYQPAGMVERFVNQQPDAARAWAASFPDGPLQSGARAAYLSVIARKDPDYARQFALLESNPERGAQVLGELSLTPTEMRDFIAPLPVELRQRAANIFFEGFPSGGWREWETNGRFFTPILEFAQIPPGMTTEKSTGLSVAMLQTTAAAAETRPLETITWLQRQPEAIAGPMFSKAFEVWVYNADQSALQWLESQGDFPWKDRALASASKVLAESDPARAVKLMSQISQTQTDMESTIRDTIDAINSELPDAISPALRERLIPARR